jgi:hypothetical protein
LRQRAVQVSGDMRGASGSRMAVLRGRASATLRLPGRQN